MPGWRAPAAVGPEPGGTGAARPPSTRICRSSTSSTAWDPRGALAFQCPPCRTPPAPRPESDNRRSVNLERGRFPPMNPGAFPPTAATAAPPSPRSTTWAETASESAGWRPTTRARSRERASRTWSGRESYRGGPRISATVNVTAGRFEGRSLVGAGDDDDRGLVAGLNSAARQPLAGAAEVDPPRAASRPPLAAPDASRPGFGS